MSPIDSSLESLAEKRCANRRECRDYWGRPKQPGRDRTGWLGRKGSNLRMLESKSSALPLGDAPIVSAVPGRPMTGGESPGADPYKASRAGPQTIQNAAGPRLCAPLYRRLRGRGGMAIRAPPEARGVPFALVRRVAQPGRALRSGRRGRRFESSLSDQFSRSA